MATEMQTEEPKTAANKKAIPKLFFIIAISVLIIAAIFYKVFIIKESNPISIGKLPEDLDTSKVIYRFYNIELSNGQTLKKTDSDMVDLKMDGQSGAAFNRWIMTTVSNCRNPDIRKAWINANSNRAATVPTVSCDTYENEKIHVSGNQNLRKFLMKNQVADITGKIIGISGDDIVVLVEDSNY